MDFSPHMAEIFSILGDRATCAVAGGGPLFAVSGAFRAPYATSGFDALRAGGDKPSFEIPVESACAVGDRLTLAGRTYYIVERAEDQGAGTATLTLETE